MLFILPRVCFFTHYDYDGAGYIAHGEHVADAMSSATPGQPRHTNNAAASAETKLPFGRRARRADIAGEMHECY